MRTWDLTDSLLSGGRTHARPPPTTQTGLRCVTIELRETEVTELVRRKLLEVGARHDLRAIRSALHRRLDESLGA
jgi:hypothetical protein